MTEDDEAILDELIPKIVLAYTVCPTVTGQTSFYLMYDSHPLMPINTLLHQRLKYVVT